MSRLPACTIISWSRIFCRGAMERYLCGELEISERNIMGRKLLFAVLTRRIMLRSANSSSNRDSKQMLTTLTAQAAHGDSTMEERMRD